MVDQLAQGAGEVVVEEEAGVKEVMEVVDIPLGNCNN
jgi:hypothetical protein